VKKITKEIVKVICAEHEGKHYAKCHQKVRNEIHKYYKKIQKRSQKALKSCACHVQASHHCSTSSNASETITDCQTNYIKSCGNTCLSRHKKKNSKRIEKFIKNICKIGKHTGNHCHDAVMENCGEVENTAKKVQIKVHIAKKVHFSKEILVRKVEKKVRSD